MDTIYTVIGAIVFWVFVISLSYYILRGFAYSWDYHCWLRSCSNPVSFFKFWSCTFKGILEFMDYNPEYTKFRVGSSEYNGFRTWIKK